MDEPRPTYPWWRRKRRVAAAVALLAVAYPLSLGPLGYLAGLGLLPGYSGAGPWPPAVYVYGPLLVFAETPPGRVLADYTNWAEGLGRRHAAE